jgi:hypothetical protein
MLHHDVSSPRLFELPLWLAVPGSVRARNDHNRWRSPGPLPAALRLAVGLLDRAASTAASVKSPRSNASGTHPHHAAANNPL